MDEEQQKLIEANKGNRSRGWCFTYHKWQPHQWEAVTAATDGIQYLLVSQELGKTGDTPHLQGYVWFHLQKSWTAFKAWLDKLLGCPKHKFVAARGSALANLVYISKEGIRVHEYGDRPKTDAEKGEGEKERAKRNLEALMNDRLEDVDPDVIAHHLAKYEYGAQKLKQARAGAAATLDGVLDNLWIYGAAGVGKDMFANEAAPDAYLKAPNTKWWCGYRGEKDVTLRDVGRSVDVDGFKVWTDRYPFMAEVKGGSLGRIRPTRMIVTSNYAPSDLFHGPDVDAVERRFQVVHCHDGMAEYLPRKLTEKPAPLRVVRRPTPPEPPSPNRFTSAMSDL